MGITNEKTITWSTQEEPELDSFPGGGGASGREIKATKDQQERNYRESSQRPKPSLIGTSITGGMLDQLIGQFSDQLAEQQRIIVQAQENIEKLKRRIQECKELKEELDKQLDDEN